MSQMGGPEMLLISNSTMPGGGFLEHALPSLSAWKPLAGREALFVPYASVARSYASAFAMAAQAFQVLGITLGNLATARDPARAVRQARLVVVGGGNTFALLHHLHRLHLLTPLRRGVAAGLPYVGWSAGAVLAGPSIRTTNSMPILSVPNLQSLGGLPFHINAHFTTATLPDHGGEGRVRRIQECLAVHPDDPVVGMWEGSLLRVRGRRVEVGPGRVTLFTPGGAVDYEAGEVLVGPGVRGEASG